MSLTKYARVQQGIVNLIAREGIAPGGRLPTEKDLAKRFDASVITVRHALSRLADRQVVRREQGRGTFVIASIAGTLSNGVVVYLSVAKSEREVARVLEAQGDISEALSERGYELRALAVGESPKRETVQLLQDVSGVLATGRLSGEWIGLLNSLDLPVAVIGSTTVGKPSPPSVSFNWRKMAILMGARLLELGARDLALITAGEGYAPSGHMRDGLRYLLNSRDIGYDSSKVLFAEQEAEGRGLLEFLERHQDLDGYLVETGFYPKMLAYLLDRPERPWLGVLSVRPRDDLWPANVIGSAFHGDVFSLGVEMLFDIIQAGGRRVKDRKLEPYLVE